MRLMDLDIIVTAPPAPGWGGQYWILVKLTTDTGVTGWGECYASSHRAKGDACRHQQTFSPDIS
jgi:L-alanine-DL-glutamate epimerase-like enolase superfamily enzyme